MRMGGPLRAEPMMIASETPPRGQAQAVEAIGDEHETPKVNGFTEGEGNA
jgi:hypothetical protein